MTQCDSHFAIGVGREENSQFDWDSRMVQDTDHSIDVDYTPIDRF